MSRLPLTDAPLMISKGITTANGNLGGTTLIDTSKTEGVGYWNGLVIRLLSGPYIGQEKNITAFAGGTFTVGAAFGGQILSGTAYAIITGGAGLNILADLAIIIAQTNKLATIELTTPYTSGFARDDIAAIGPTNTTPVSITPTFPTGATKVRVIAVVDLFVENDTANIQKITPILQVQLAGGGYNNRWNPGGDIVAVPATDGTFASIRALVDITADVVSGSQTDFRWSVTQSSANSVHYTSQAAIFLTYRG